MRRITPVLLSLFLTCAVSAARPADPIPEAQQAALALKYLDAYRGPPPKVPPHLLHVVYFTPADRDPEPRYRERLEAILEDIRAFYRDGMERAGFGPKTFDLARDAEGKLIIHLVKGREPESAYPRSPGGKQSDIRDASTRDKILRESRADLEIAGITPDNETILYFCNLAAWDSQARTFRHHSPFIGHWTQTNGLCYAVDTVIQNLADLPKKEPVLHDAEWGNESLGRFNTIFIGGIAHELGHAFGLPHGGERWDEKARGISIMGGGNFHYREELRGEGPGAFLTMASALKLASRPLFSKSDKVNSQKPWLDENEWQLSTHVTRADLAGRRGALRVEGTVKGAPPVYGVIGYFDSLHDGGYRAPTATAVPDAQGRFAMEVSDLAPSENAGLRIEYCHVNGAISEDHALFRVAPDGTVDLAQWDVRKALEPVTKAVIAEYPDEARRALETIEGSHAPDLAKEVALKLVGSILPDVRKTPAEVAPTVLRLPLGDARPQLAEVGWLKPASNRIPLNDEIRAPYLESGRIYATGLFAHAPSRYVFDLGGKWQTLHGEGGLHTWHQHYGSVVFLIKADGREVFRSPVIREASKASYIVDVTGIKTLELVVDDAGNGNANDWALWLDPTLFR
ncbi:MAG: NPCBM/NEW2 domain-containing protein [Chthoniobacter sp.]|nr:NPCBM/NEW2 domain-containing protein [Chthoniobacter sp.]